MGNFSQFAKLIFLLINLFFSVSVFANELISVNRIPSDLPQPGDDLIIEFKSKRGTSQDLFLVVNSDQKLNYLKPTKTDTTNRIYTFVLPSPLVSLNYFAILKDGDTVIEQTKAYNLSRNCLPRISQEEIVAADAKSLLKKAKDLEREINSLENVRQNLILLKKLINDKGM